MSGESLARSDVWIGTANEAEYDGICAAVMATERGRWFLTEYASRNRHTDTHAVLGALARLEAAIRSGQAAQAPVFSANGVERMPSPAFTAAADRLQDIAYILRERAIDADLCDALDAAVREIAAVGGLAAKTHTGDNAAAASALEHANGDAADSDAATAMKIDLTVPETLEPAPLAETAVTVAEASPIAAAEPAPSNPRSEAAMAALAALGDDNHLGAAAPDGSDTSPRWYIEAPDFAFHRAVPEQAEIERAELRSENGHPHVLLPQAQLLPGPQDDPADLFETPENSFAASSGSVTPVAAIITPATIAPPVMRLTPRAPDPLAGLRALSEEEVIALFS